MQKNKMSAVKFVEWNEILSLIHSVNWPYSFCIRADFLESF